MGPGAGLCLTSWHRDEEAWEEWAIDTGRLRVAVDGLLVATVDTEHRPQPAVAFVEVDRGTMTQPRLRAKALRYLLKISTSPSRW